METIKSAFNCFAERYADAFGQILLIAAAIGLGFFAGLAAGHYLAYNFGPVTGLPI